LFFLLFDRIANLSFDLLDGFAYNHGPTIFSQVNCSIWLNRLIGRQADR
jgi:hypothetical protein